jgi:hypothetical protein
MASDRKIRSARVRRPVLVLYFYVRFFVRPDRLVLQEGWLYRLLVVSCVLSTRVQFSRFYFVWIPIQCKDDIH